MSTAAAKPDDSALLARWREGTPAAWAEIMATYRDPVYQIAFRIVRNEQDAEEIISDTFLAAHRNLPNFRGDCPIRLWLIGISRNRALNRWHYWRRRRRAETLPLDTPLTEGGPTLAEALPDPAPGVRDQVHLGESITAIARAIHHLNPAEQAMIFDRAAGATYEELGAARGVGLGTVKSRMARAREKLRLHLAA